MGGQAETGSKIIILSFLKKKDSLDQRIEY